MADRLLLNELKRIAREIAGDGCEIRQSDNKNQFGFWIEGKRHKAGAIPRMFVQVHRLVKEDDFQKMGKQKKQDVLQKLGIEIASAWKKEITETETLTTSSEPIFIVTAERLSI